MRELFELEKLKISKSIIDLVKKQNSFINNNEIIPYNNSYSISCSNSKMFSQLIDTSSSEGRESTSEEKNKKFNLQSLKIVLSESFELKSYYKNINSLSEGKMISNKKYKKYIENIVNKYINKFNGKNKSNKCLISYKSLNNKKFKNNYKIKKSNEFEGKKFDDDSCLTEGNLSSKLKYNDCILDTSNKLLDDNFHMGTKQTKDNFLCSEKDKNTGKNKSASKIIENKNFPNNNKNINKKELKNNYMETCIYKGNLEEQNLKYIKKENKKREKNNNNDIKSVKSSLFVFNEYNEQSSKNNLSILNKNIYNIEKEIQDTKFDGGNAKKCLIF